MTYNSITFEYFNRSSDVVEIWLSAAPGTTELEFMENQPINFYKHDFLGTIYFFKIPSHQKFKYSSKYKPINKKEISDKEKKYFLRNTELIPVNDSTRAQAKDIIKNLHSENTKEQAYTIFNFVRKNFEYSSKLKERGFEYTIERRKGDCGELSAVFASYCRSLQIPCRIMVGAFKGKFNHHVWNEVYIPQEGWIPVDVSLAMYTPFRYPLRSMMSAIKWGTLKNKKRYFGNIEQGRVVFSIDPEIYLEPAYKDSKASVDDMTFNIAGKKISWGYESLKGRAPYMQPIYPKLNDTFRKIKHKDVLGKFEVSAPHQTSYKTKINALYIGLVLAFLSMVISAYEISIPIWFDILLGTVTYLSLGIFSVLTIIRNEYNWLVLILVTFFLLSALGFFYNIIKSLI
ncbi:transglutaminase domain-containing protein [Virgibacillus kimchii]